jgi:transposase-like protein
LKSDEVGRVQKREALGVKIRDEGSVKNKAVYLPRGIAADGTKDVLGIWPDPKKVDVT